MADGTNRGGARPGLKKGWKVGLYNDKKPETAISDGYGQGQELPRLAKKESTEDSIEIAIGKLLHDTEVTVAKVLSEAEMCLTLVLFQYDPFRRVTEKGIKQAYIPPLEVYRQITLSVHS
ncbi:hypothetical protein C5167_035518 [Papaver somniferum]|uniref:Uncharacterized protein n=1 Tax=Papaver somniferum TaxID=3469 RepID=A0A4Y7KG60_PAPSO|nr:hypothetical protein C5167_035518 [Papaver somniferum]